MHKIHTVQHVLDARLVAIRQSSYKRALKRARDAVPSRLGWPRFLLLACALYCFAGGSVVPGAKADCYGTGITIRCVGNGPADGTQQWRVRQIVHRAPEWVPTADELKSQFPRIQVSCVDVAL